MKVVPLGQAKNELSAYVEEAQHDRVLVTRHGKPAGVLIGFGSDEDWLEYRLENHPEFLARIATARGELDEGLGTRLEDLGDRSG